MQKRYFWLLMTAVALLILAMCFILIPKLSVGLIQSQCKECGVADALNIAAQIGRLDVVSLVLSMFAISMGFFVIFSFLAIKDEARKTAKYVADDYFAKEFNRIDEIISEQVKIQVQKEMALFNPSGEALSKGSWPDISSVDTDRRVEEDGNNDSI